MLTILVLLWVATTELVRHWRGWHRKTLVSGTLTTHVLHGRLLRDKVLVLLWNRLHLVLVPSNIHRRWLLLDRLRAELFRLSSKNVRRCPLWYADSHYPRVQLAHMLQQELIEVLPGPIPIVIFILHQ